MPQRKAAEKALKTDKKRKQTNLVIKRKVKTATKSYLKALREKQNEEAKKYLDKAYKELDKAAAKNYIHNNKANRKKSRLAKRLKSI